MLRYCTFSSIYTTTWCYVDWGGGVGGWVGGDVNVHWHWRNHRNKEFCRLLTDINSTKLSKIAGTQQIDRQWLSLKKFVFSNLHRKVNTLVGSEVNPSLRRRCFQYVWRCNLQTCTPLVMLKELAKLVKNNDADNWQLLKELKRDVLMQKHYKNARRLTRPRPGGWWFGTWFYFPQ